MSIWRRDVNGVTDEDQKRLQLVGDIRIGEMVNRIRKGELLTTFTLPIAGVLFLTLLY